MSDGDGFRRLTETKRYQGHIWHVALAEFESPTGERFERDIVRSPGAVGVVPLMFDPEGNPSVVLVRQYRPPFEDELIEIPAGMRDIDGEDPAEVARRELVEEAGLAAGAVELLTEILPSPGLTDSVTSIYLATGCTPTDTDRHGPEEDHMEIVHLPLADAIDQVERGEIRDAKTVVGLLLTDRRLHRADENGRGGG